MQIDNLSRQLEDTRLDNNRFQEKVEELEKWIVLLTNNFYAGTPNSIDVIQKSLQANDQQRSHIFELKKTILFEKKKYFPVIFMFFI